MKQIKNMKKKRFVALIGTAMLTSFACSAYAHNFEAYSAENKEDASINYLLTKIANIAGRVTGQNGEPLAGVTVQVKGTALKTTTDNDGRFTINNVTANQTLVFSYVGYDSQEIQIGNQSTINIKLKESVSGLDEIVIIGYQSVKKRDLTGANTLISNKEANKITGGSVAETLQGLAPGVSVRNGGAPGQNAIIEIRGVGSFLDRNPLYVIDGMIADANSTINNNDIESIQILKDASAAAIYGSRAGNGVVIITTKKGKEGPAEISFSGKYSVQQIPKTWDLMNATEYAAIKKQAYINSGKVVPANISTAFNPNNNTDWQDATLGTGYVQDYNLGISGGGNNSRYLISGSYFKNKGVVTGYDFDRASLRINTEGKRGRFKVGENLLISHTNDRRPQGINPFYDMVTMLPIIPIQGNAYKTATNPSGYGIGTDDAVTYAFNPIAVNDLRKRNNTYSKIVGNGYVDFEVTKWLNYKFNAGLEASFDYLNVVRKPGVWQYRQSPESSFIDDYRQTFINTLLEHTLNFNKSFGKHNINGVVGFTQQEISNRGTGANRLDISSYDGNYLTTIGSATGIQTNSGGVSNLYRLQGILSRVNYNYEDKYLLTASYRRDSDSRFGDDFRSGNFPSVAAAWRISKEKFFNVKWVSDLKLRASYGELGIVTIPAFQYLGLLNQSPIAIFGPNQTPNGGATQARLFNPDLRWETRISKNIGFDANLFNDKLTLTFDAYNSLSKNALVQVPLALYLGNLGGDPYVNAASIRNKGIEVSATYRNTNNAVKWDISGNFTTINNKVESIYAEKGVDYLQMGNTRSTVGRSIGEWYVLQTNGLFQSQTEINNYKGKNGQVIQPNAKPGDVKFVDLNGDGAINDDDRAYSGSPWPTLQTGAQFNASYKGFSLNMQFVGVFGLTVYNDVRRSLDSYDNSNFRKGVSPWSTTNTNTSDSRLGLLDGDAGLIDNARSNSDRWLENGSYFRLRNLEIGYDLPKTLLGKAKVKSARLYVSGQNLFTITKYSGLDPDIVGSNIQERGLDNGNWPSSRIYSFGVQCNF